MKIENKNPHHINDEDLQKLFDWFLEFSKHRVHQSLFIINAFF